MKPTWSRYRYSIPNLLLTGLLSGLAGWSAASGYMLVLLWINAPDKADHLIPLLERTPFVFFPPLFGSTPIPYLLASFSIFLCCGIAALVLRLATRTQKPRAPGA